MPKIIWSHKTAQKMVAGETRLKCDPVSIVHPEYISHLTYTCSWHKVSKNRVLLTLFSAPLE